MASSYTRRGRSQKQGTGDNENAWGPELNIGALERSDEMWGTTEVAVNGPVILTSAQGLADQAREVTLILTGTGGVLTAPAVDKPYMVINNCTGNVTLTPQAGTGVVVRAGQKVWYYTNAAGDHGYVIDHAVSDFLAALADISMGGFKITNLANGVAGTDAVTVQQLAPYAAAAAASAMAASGSASAAATSYSNTLALYTDFLKRYLGAYASDPTVDPLGNTLQIGGLYFNTAGSGTLKVWNGSAWAVASATVTIASQAQAEAGADNTAFITSLRAAQAIAARAMQMMIVRDEKTSGTGGGAGTASTYITRNLNTVAYNTITGASLSSNQIILPAGTYHVYAECPGYGVNGHKARLYNVTDAAVIFFGLSTRSIASGGVQSQSVVVGTFVLAATKTISLQHWVQTTAANAAELGFPTSTGDVEVFSQITIRKIA